MKKFLSIFMVAATVCVGATSCSDFLEEDNKTGETADLTYQTETGIEGLVNSAYAYSRGWWGKEPSLGLSEMGSDLFYYGYDNKQKSMLSYDLTSECYGFESTSGTNVVNDNHCLDQYWELFYAGVDVCNNTLKYVPLCSVLKEQKKTAYLGDAYFLRALYYSQMVALWGPIPYNSEPFTEIKTNLTRVPEAVVYKNILDDLKKSMENFKAAGVTSSKAATGEGRANYYSAEALYARVALYAASWLGKNSVEGYGDLYAEALNAAQDVISNSGASFYSRYADTWNMNNEEAGTNKENLFAVHYNNVLSSGYDNCVPYRFADGGTGTFNSLLTRKGYGSNGGSAMNLMFVSLWNNGCSDLGGSGNKITTVFQRITGSANAGMPYLQRNENGYLLGTDGSYMDENGDIYSKSGALIAKKGEYEKKDGNNYVEKNSGKLLLETTQLSIDCSAYYSPYGRGFTRYLPSLYLWKELDKIKTTDQRYNGTLLTHYNIPKELAYNATNYPDMVKQEFKSYDDAYKEDGNYFNGGGYAILYSILDGDSPEGKALQAEAKNKYRLQFAFGGDIPVYTSGDVATALPTEGKKEVSDVYGDSRYNDAKIEGRRSYPGIKKFLDDQLDPNYMTYDISYRDIMVLRLAEMYLIKAEAELQTGNATAALETINTLRNARAISGQDNSIQAVYGESTVDIETILRERAIELCGEFQRWFDLKRTHTLIDHVKKYNAQASANIALKHYYRPIPATEFDAVKNKGNVSVTQDANGVLQYTTASESFWQNPGY